jgi:hypothetical protein
LVRDLRELEDNVMRLLFSDTMVGESYWSDTPATPFEPDAVAAYILAKLEAGMDDGEGESATKMVLRGWFPDGDRLAVFVFDMTDGLTSGLIHGTAHRVYDPNWVPRAGFTEI